MIDRKRLQQIKDYAKDNIGIALGDFEWLLTTIDDLQDEVGSLDEQLDLCRRVGGYD